jgi:hypothetical protein
MSAKKKAKTSKYLLKIEKYTINPESDPRNVGASPADARFLISIDMQGHLDRR